MEPREYLELFLSHGLELPGSGVVAHVALGHGGEVSTTINWGTLVFPAFVTAETGVALGGARSSELVLLLTRLPMVGGLPERPVSLLAARGQLTEVSVKLSGKLGLGVKAGVSPTTKASTTFTSKDTLKARKQASKEEFGKVGSKVLGQLGAEAAASIALNAHCAYTAQMLFARDPGPQYFADARDSTLVAAFGEFLAEAGTRVGVKERALKLLTTEAAGLLAGSLPNPTIANQIKTAITGGRTPFAQLEAALQSAASYLMWGAYAKHATSKRYLRMFDEVLADLKEQGERNRLVRFFSKEAKRRVKDQATLLVRQVGGEEFLPEVGRSGYASLGDLSTRLQSMVSLLQMSDREVLSILGKVTEMLKILVVYQETERSSRTDSDAPVTQDADRMPSNLNYVSLVGHEPSAGASIDVDVGLTVNTGVSSELGVSRSDGVVRKAKFTNYRLQQVSSPTERTMKGAVVITQDTKVSYVQTVTTHHTKVKATLGGKDMLDPDEYQPNAVMTMSYQSYHVRWTPPELQSDEASAVVHPGCGSSIGVSVPTGDFVSLVGEGADGSLGQSLCRSLGVDAGELDALLAELDYLASLDAKENGAPSAIFLEATFARPELAEIPVEWQPTRPELVSASLAAVEDSPKALEALRVRYRQADTYSESVDGEVKLGLTKVVKVGIKLRSVAEASHSGMVDLAIRWYGTRAGLNEAGAAIPEDHVPAPILFTQ